MSFPSAPPAPGWLPPPAPPRRSGGASTGVVVMLVLILVLVLGGGGVGGYSLYHLNQQVAQRQRLDDLAWQVGTPEYFRLGPRSYSTMFRPEVTVHLDGYYPCPRPGSSCAEDLTGGLVIWLAYMEMHPGFEDIKLALTLTDKLEQTFADYTVRILFGCEQFDAKATRVHCSIDVTFTLVDK
jgi:hypothetical protein